MKSFVLYLVLLAMLSRVAKPEYDDGGYNTLTTITNDDPTSCLVTLSLQIFAKRIRFSATVIQNNYSDCTHHDLQITSMFRGDNLNAKITLAPTANPNVKSGDLKIADVTTYNGTSCMYSGYEVEGKLYYSCQFQYNNIVFIVDFGLEPATGDFTTDNWFNLFNPYFGANVMVTQNGIDIWKTNSTYHQIVGMLYKECGSWSSIIPSLSTQFTITGTELQSNTVNLTAFWGEYIFNSIWIRKKNVPHSNYKAYSSPGAWFAFNNTLAGNCSDTRSTYARILPDMDYCKYGCDFSALILTDHAVTLLQSAGFVTQA